MAEVLSQFLFKKVRARYDVFLDGRIWKLMPGEDYSAKTKPRYVRELIYRRARQLNLRARVAIDGVAVIVQALPKVDGAQ